ncbi:MAG: hypothetical protein WB762_08725 [Candidatus Sulfotelmatobacter sp.]
MPCHVVFLIQVLMGLGETQRLTLLDDAHHDITARAQWTIVDRTSDLGFFSVVDGVPHVFSNKYGVVEGDLRYIASPLEN